jgi:hypothetical protein
MDHRDDTIVTRFCEVVTPRYTAATRERARLATIEMGEAMAPAPEFPSTSGGNRSGAGAAPMRGAARAVSAALAAWLAVAGCGGCGGCGDEPRPGPRPTSPVAPDRAAADPARAVTTALDGAAPQLAAAVFAELAGDPAAARAGFEAVLTEADAPAGLAARAALHLARLESRAGKTRRALELAARASALAPGDPAIVDGVSELQADMVAAAGAGDLRGPRLGTPLPGVEPGVADAFAAAERAFARLHTLRIRPVLETLSRSIRVVEDTSEAVVARYRAIAERGGLPRVAASYRAGSAYHDLAQSLLLFELPPELEPGFVAGLRHTLRTSATGYLKKAVAEYRTALAAPKHPDDELWRLAAETDLRDARDLLIAAGEK